MLLVLNNLIKKICDFHAMLPSVVMCSFRNDVCLSTVVRSLRYAAAAAAAVAIASP